MNIESPTISSREVSASSTMPRLLAWLLTGLVSAAASTTALAADPVEAGSKPRLIELFTSHGCSSCPAADELLGELLEQDDSLMALEYHVDYWNTLVHGSDGNFVDPFSSPEQSQRQREYNAAGLSGRPGVYTPQAVINGVTATVGSNRRHIQMALAASRPSPLQMRIGKEGSGLRVTLTGSEEQLSALEGTDIRLVRYKEHAVTHVTGGENRHLDLTNHHIVFSAVRLGEIVASGEMTHEFESPSEGEGCVIMVQEGALTPVYAAVECP